MAKCTTCAGHGRVIIHEFGKFAQKWGRCTTCNGTGKE